MIKDDCKHNQIVATYHPGSDKWGVACACCYHVFDVVWEERNQDTGELDGLEVLRPHEEGTA